MIPPERAGPILLPDRADPKPAVGPSRRVALMQPYVFPYIGYFQLIAQADVFVSYDDVTYIKGGWINRNRIADQGRPVWLTLPVRHAPHTLPINRREYAFGRDTQRAILRRIEALYRRAPHFAPTMELIEAILSHEDWTVSGFNENGLVQIARAIGISTPFLRSSRLDKDDSLRAQDRVIDICRRLGATDYINPAGGRHLYDPVQFRASGLELKFLVPGPRSYPVPGLDPCVHLSIIDVLMSCDRDQIAGMLSQCRIAPGDDRQTD